MRFSGSIKEFMGGSHDVRFGDVLHTSEVAARASRSSDCGARPAGKRRVLHHAALRPPGEETKLADCRPKQRHDRPFPGRRQVHQSGVIGNHCSTPVHCRRSLQKGKRSGAIADLCVRCKRPDLCSDGGAALPLGGRSEQDDRQRIGAGQGGSRTGEPFRQPHLGCVPRRRAESEQTRCVRNAGRVQHVLRYTVRLIGNENFRAPAVILDTE